MWLALHDGCECTWVASGMADEEDDDGDEGISNFTIEDNSYLLKLLFL